MLPRIRSSFFYMFVLGLTFCAAALLLCALLMPAKPARPDEPLSVNAEAAPLYTAHAAGNRMVIYQAGRSEPVMITEVDIRTLPDADQAALASGIPLADATALAHLLEDYDG